MSDMKDLLEKARRAPTSPGVYLMKNDLGQVIYVGKAKNLRHRLRSYFSNGDQGYKTQVLVSHIADFDWILTDTELEALMLECTLIKKHRPRYNVSLRDDKSYPYLRISIHDKFPQVSIVRRPTRDDALYFGPYTSAYAIREMLNILLKVFPLRDCSDSKFANRTRPCINYDIGICAAPCVNFINDTDYGKLVDGLILFLKGKNREILKDLEEKMYEKSELMEFEEAASLRDQLFSLRRMLETQKMVSQEILDQDFIGIHLHEHDGEIVMLYVRQGQLIGKRAFPLRHVPSEKEELISEFLSQYYSEHFVPDEIIIPFFPSDGEILKRFLSETKGRRVHLLAPSQGGKAKLLTLAAQNARSSFADRRQGVEKVEEVLLEMKKMFGLKNLPYVMECYDISNIGGEEAVGSQAVFVGGEPDKSRYRRYKIRTVEGANDYAMMAEVLGRRFKKIKEGGEGDETSPDRPDLIVIDGGKGQLNTARLVLKELELKEIDVISLAKEKVLSGFRELEIRKKGERVFVPHGKDPFVLPPRSPVIQILQRIRDEAHRFAITYHKKLRGKRNLTSLLDGIPHIGQKRKETLLRHFLSIEEMKLASLEELASLAGMDKKSAHEVFKFFKAK